jgi:hypothetical protein
MRLPGLVDHAHSTSGDFIEDLVVGNMPIAISRSHGGEGFLERFPPRRGFPVIESAAEQTIQTKTVREARNRLAYAAPLRFC